MTTVVSLFRPRLPLLLAEHPRGRVPNVFRHRALMTLHGGPAGRPPPNRAYRRGSHAAHVDVGEAPQISSPTWLALLHAARSVCGRSRPGCSCDVDQGLSCHPQRAASTAAPTKQPKCKKKKVKYPIDIVYSLDLSTATHHHIPYRYPYVDAYL